MNRLCCRAAQQSRIAERTITARITTIPEARLRVRSKCIFATADVAIAAQHCVDSRSDTCQRYCFRDTMLGDRPSDQAHNHGPRSRYVVQGKQHRSGYRSDWMTSLISRRNFLKTTGMTGMAALAATAVPRAWASPMGLPVGIQLY